MSWFTNNKKEFIVAFLFSIVLGILSAYNLTSWDQTSFFLQEGSFSGKVASFLNYSIAPLTYPIDFLLYSILHLPIPLHALYYPFAFLILWTLYLTLPILFIKRQFPTRAWFVKYIPSFLVVSFLTIAILPGMFDTASRDTAFIEKCLGEKAQPSTLVSQREWLQENTKKRQQSSTSLELPTSIPLTDDALESTYFGYDCLSEFLDEKMFDINPSSSTLSQNQKNDLIDGLINYCLSLPQKPVNPKILHDQALVPGLSYNQICLHQVTISLGSEDRFILSLDDFMEKFPQWKTKALKDINGNYFVRVEPGQIQDQEGFQADVTKYICKKVYGYGTPLDNDREFSTCMKPSLTITDLQLQK